MPGCVSRDSAGLVEALSDADANIDVETEPDLDTSCLSHSQAALSPVLADKDDPLPDLIAAMIQADADVWWLRRTGETTWEVLDPADVPDTTPGATNEGVVRIDPFRALVLRNVELPTDWVSVREGFLVENFEENGPLCSSLRDGRPRFDAQMTLTPRNTCPERARLVAEYLRNRLGGALT